jgi:hypothetical protein
MIPVLWSRKSGFRFAIPTCKRILVAGQVSYVRKFKGDRSAIAMKGSQTGKQSHPLS